MGSLLICLLLASTACGAIETGGPETAAKFVTKPGEAVGLMGEIATAASDAEELELPESFKEQVESALEAGGVIKDLMPSSDAARPLVGNRVTHSPVARQWEVTEGENSECSSKFRIIKADRWGWDDHFYVVVEFIDLEGRQTVFHGNCMSPDFKTEWVVDMRYVNVTVPWCGIAVITVYDDIVSDDLPSEKYQVQIEVLTSCDCP